MGLLDCFTRLLRRYIPRKDILWIPAFAGMTEKEGGITEESDGFDESNPYN